MAFPSDTFPSRPKSIWRGGWRGQRSCECRVDMLRFHSASLGTLSTPKLAPDVETGDAFDCTLGIHTPIVVFHGAHPIGHSVSPVLIRSTTTYASATGVWVTTRRRRRNLKYLDRLTVRSSNQGVPRGTNRQRAKSGRRRSWDGWIEDGRDVGGARNGWEGSWFIWYRMITLGEMWFRSTGRM